MDIAHMRAHLQTHYPLVTKPVTTEPRVWNITCARDQDALLDFAEELKHFPYGFLLWEASIGLARTLMQHPDLVAGKRVLELGAGVGVPGLVAQSLGAHVAQTDHQPHALWLAQVNAWQNGIEGITTFEADWQQWTHRGRYDVLLGADIMYERSMHPHLEDVFSRALAPNGKILLADPGRQQALEFAEYLQKQGWQLSSHSLHVEQTEAEQLARPVEIAILTVTR